MTKVKNTFVSFLVVLMLIAMAAMAAVPAFGAQRVVCFIPMNQIYNVEVLGGVWNNQGKSDGAYSNFYQPSYYHWSHAELAYNPDLRNRAYANAGSWSYANFSMLYCGNCSFHFGCGY